MDRQYQKAKISVWWDIENCPVPNNFNARLVSSRIHSALRALNYDGDVSISAYGDITLMPCHVVEALNWTGVSIIHVNRGPDASDMRMMTDMMLWSIDNPMSNCMLISSDCDYLNLLRTLRERRYHILLVHQEPFAEVLAQWANVRWLWRELLFGELPLFYFGNLRPSA